MSATDNISPEDPVAAMAAAFAARVHDAQAGESDWLALNEWLEADAAHVRAFDLAESAWLMLDLDREDIGRALEGATVVSLEGRRARRGLPPWAAIAAAIVVVLGGAGVMAPSLLTPTRAYDVAPGPPRTLKLADGSQVVVNGGSSLTVRLGPRERRVVMSDAEATFDVAHDAGRPFLISAGDVHVRVVGTEFNVRKSGGDVAVVVRRGIVEVSGKDGDVSRLTAGQQLAAHGGDLSPVVSADADAAMAWREGRLVCEPCTLERVASEFSRRFGAQVRAAPGSERVNFTGVLILDGQDAALERLSALAPVVVERNAETITLRFRSN